MSTRTRLVLKYGNSTYTGALAIVKILQATVPGGFMSMNIPNDWKEMTKRERLIWLAVKLPKNAELTMFQEPKKTRRGRSAYWKFVDESKKPSLEPPKDFIDGIVRRARQAIAQEGQPPPPRNQNPYAGGIFRNLPPGALDGVVPVLVPEPNGPDELEARLREDHFNEEEL